MNSSHVTAAVLVKHNSDLAVMHFDMSNLTQGQVLVQLDFSGVCRSQLMEVQGLRGPDPWLPHLLGHEGAGVVAAIGPGVTKVEVGQTVICGWLPSSGMDAEPPQFSKGELRINAGKVTTFSRMSIVSENRIYSKPKNLPNDQAVLFGCALLTGAGMVLNEFPPNESDSVLLLGLGGVGMAATIGALSLPSSQIIVADPSEEKRRLALDFGATVALDPTDDGFLEAVLDISRGGVDICYEAAGQVATIELGFEATKPKSGTLVFASHPPSGERISIDPHALISGRSIRGSWGGGSKPDQDIPRIWNAVQELGIDLGQLISNRYSLEDVNLALRDLDAGSVMRPLLDMSL